MGGKPIFRVMGGIPPVRLEETLAVFSLFIPRFSFRLEINKPSAQKDK